MSKKGQQGPGAHVPTPPPDPARVDPAPVAPADPVAASPGVDTSAVTPPFVEPFEPPPDVQPMTDRDRKIPLDTELAKVTLEREQLQAEREQLQKERDALAEARGRLERDRRQSPSKAKPDVDPRNVPEDLVEVEALTGVTDTLRVVLRNPGERFKLRRDQAEAAEEQGLVEIL